jgi:hypothetical protein
VTIVLLVRAFSGQDRPIGLCKAFLVARLLRPPGRRSIQCPTPSPRQPLPLPLQIAAAKLGMASAPPPSAPRRSNCCRESLRGDDVIHQPDSRGCSRAFAHALVCKRLSPSGTCQMLVNGRPNRATLTPSLSLDLPNLSRILDRPDRRAWRVCCQRRRPREASRRRIWPR